MFPLGHNIRYELYPPLVKNTCLTLICYVGQEDLCSFSHDLKQILKPSPSPSSSVLYFITFVQCQQSVIVVLH